ncbi:sulfatase [Kribbella sp. CA-245084]|uniref:sulfatase n=1 Tax=Kribbella sp. CA-245084 TaxID=3239940 RepID=UPI003D8E737B
MRAIYVLFDTLNRHFLPPYGNNWVHAPNFARLAQRTATFDTCYGGSMPCMPARRELHTGRYNFLHRSWGPLEPHDESMPELLKQSGVHTHLATDHQHYFEDGGATYHTRFNTWEFFRGQEGDNWKGHVAEPDYPDEFVPMHKAEHWKQDWVNRGYLEQEENHPQTRTFDAGLHFISTNVNQDRWMVQIEGFDPHEPFFTYKQYKDLYPDAYDGPHFDWPNYSQVTERPEAVEHIRYQYAALLSMCDNSLGRVLDLMDAHNMWEDTMLIVGTDHGFFLGEKGWWAKNVQPWYEEVIHLPLFIWDPRSRQQGVRRSSLVQTIDIAPTLLDFFGLTPPATMTGRALGDTIAHDTPVHDAGLFGIHGGHVSVTDGRYVYMRASATPANGPLHDYTLMPTHMVGRFRTAELARAELMRDPAIYEGYPVLKVPVNARLNTHGFGSLLFDLQTDPHQDRPLEDDELEQRMAQLLVDTMRRHGAPPEQYQRLGLPATGDVAPEHLLIRRQSGLAAEVSQRIPDRDELPAGRLSALTPLRQLIADTVGQSIVDQYLPGLDTTPMFGFLAGMSPYDLSAFAPGVLSAKNLSAMADQLAEVS